MQYYHINIRRLDIEILCGLDDIMCVIIHSIIYGSAGAFDSFWENRMESICHPAMVMMALEQNFKRIQ